MLTIHDQTGTYTIQAHQIRATCRKIGILRRLFAGLPISITSWQDRIAA